MEFPWLDPPPLRRLEGNPDDLARGEYRPFGVRKSEVVEAVDQRVIPIDRGHSLRDLFKAGFVLFSPAVLAATKLMRDDPVVEFVRRFPQFAYSGQLQQIDTQQPVFHGLGYLSLPNGGKLLWDHRLYVADQQVWPHARDFLSMLSFYHPRTKEFYRTGYYSVPAPDVADDKIRRVAPTVPVVVFCAVSSKEVVYLRPGKRSWEPLRLARAPSPVNIKEERQLVLGRLGLP